MGRWTTFLLATGSGLLILSIWLLNRAEPPPVSDLSADSAPPATSLSESSDSLSSSPAPDVPKPKRDSELPDEAEAALDEYLAFFQLREQFSALSGDAGSMDEESRQQALDQLTAQLHQLEQQQRVSAAESLLIQLALLKYAPDQTSAKQQGEALIQRYKALSQERLRQHEENPDPRFVSYKEREAEILKEVMAMSHYPDGLSREDYLARRLQAVRSEIYAVEENPQ